MFPKGSRFLLVTRSLFAALHNIISYYAMKHLPLPDVTIINATGAVFACVPARMFLKVKNLKHTYTLNLKYKVFPNVFTNHHIFHISTIVYIRRKG